MDMDAELGRLGLAERSVRLLTGRDIWGSITPLLAPRRNLVAAFGHVGPGAAALLPLEPGDTVITDASLDTVLSGATSPHALLHWVKAGVIVHSLRGLNAKLVIAEDDPSFVVVGSADVTAAGPRQLFEAVTVSHEKHTVEEAQEAWLEWCDLAGPSLTASDLEPLLEQYGAGKLVTSPRTPAPSRPAAPARPVVTSRPATPVRPATPTPPPSPVRPATPPPSPVRPAEPAPAAEVAPAPPAEPPAPEPEPVAAPAVVNEPDAGDTPDTTETPADVPRPSWPRPAELYLVSLVEGGEPSAEAEYRLEELTREYTHPGENGEQPFRVELFWADDGQGQDPPRTLRPGVHVIRVYSQKQGRALVGSQIAPPGLVLQAHTDEFAYPRRTYCYVLTRESSAKPAFGELRKALVAIGEKPNFRNSFQVPRKIEALLGLWPDLGYDPK
jgi:outer membrane biosynthesis protein TonB